MLGYVISIFLASGHCHTDQAEKFRRCFHRVHCIASSSNSSVRRERSSRASEVSDLPTRFSAFSLIFVYVAVDFKVCASYGFAFVNFLQV